MKTSFNSERRIKATRKPHYCDGCYQDLPVGSSCLAIAQVFEGEFNSLHLCGPCEDVWRTFPAGESWTLGELRA